MGASVPPFDCYPGLTQFRSDPAHEHLARPAIIPRYTQQIV